MNFCESLKDSYFCLLVCRWRGDMGPFIRSCDLEMLLVLPTTMKKHTENLKNSY